jgi:competence protein ComEC
VLVFAGPWWPCLGRASALVIDYAVRALLDSSALTEQATWVAWNVPVVPVGLVVLYYSALLLLADPPSGRVRMMAAWVAVGTVVLIVSAPAAERTRPVPGRLRVSVLDVGQGDAILAQLPGGESLLVDAGGSSAVFDGGRRIVTPAVWALGTRSLTWLAVTHGDRDHVGGAVGAAEALGPREVWEGVATAGDGERAALRRTAARQGIAWRTVLAGARVEAGGVSIEALSPPVPDWERQRVRNDDSIVLRLRYGRVELLLTGDAGVDVESGLDGLGTLPIRILKVGHHGSRTSTGDALLARFRPQVALISVGRGNAFGHPAPDVLQRLVAGRAEVFRTDLDGAVSVETDGRSVRVTTALGRSWSLSSLGPT